MVERTAGAASVIGAFVVAVCQVAGAAPAASEPRPRTDIVVKGSDTMVVLMKHWAQAYSRIRPETSIQVTGGGTGTGMAALVNGTTTLCMASRSIRTDEIEAGIKAFRRRPVRYEVALDALVAYVNPANPVADLRLETLAELFTGRIRHWRELGGPDRPVTLYSRENSSGTYEFFKDHVLAGRDFAPQTQTMPGTPAVLAAVARDPSGIGYGGLAFDPGVRPLAIRRGPDAPAVAATREAVSSDRYPIGRHLYLYVNPALDRGAVRDFIDWIRSEPGQRIVGRLGYYPLPVRAARNTE